MGLIEPSFYARDALEVAWDLLGCRLKHEGVEILITEVEAYRKEGDSANHCRSGRTRRNAPMWGPPGRAYIYLCYGIHLMLNLVTDQDGEGAAVLIRAGQVGEGLDIIRSRRGAKEGPVLLTGPGKVAQALGLDLGMNESELFVPGGLELHQGRRPQGVLAGPRIGIGYAQPEHVLAPWRLAAAGTGWVSHPAPLEQVTSRAHYFSMWS
jgi:DNA-3-methyladenine glycosylase